MEGKQKRRSGEPTSCNLQGDEEGTPAALGYGAATKVDGEGAAQSAGNELGVESSAVGTANQIVGESMLPTAHPASSPQFVGGAAPSEVDVRAAMHSTEPSNDLDASAPTANVVVQNYTVADNGGTVSEHGSAAVPNNAAHAALASSAAGNVDGEGESARKMKKKERNIKGTLLAMMVQLRVLISVQQKLDGTLHIQDTAQSSRRAVFYSVSRGEVN